MRRRRVSQRCCRRREVFVAQFGSVDSARDVAVPGSTLNGVEHLEIRVMMTASSEADFFFRNGEITGYSGAGGDVVVPATISGQPVTSIGEAAFIGKSSVTSITLPAGLTSIGNRAFAYCTGLASVALPVGLTSLGKQVFYSCTGLAGIHAPAEGEFFRSIDGVLYDESGTRLIAYPAGRQGPFSVSNPVASIDDDAFAWCAGLSGISLPAGLTTIGEEAFHNCSGLETVSLPAGLASIGRAVFSGCTGLESISVSVENQSFRSIDGVLYDASSTRLIAYPASRRGHFAVPQTVSRIENSAFALSGLTSITLPEGLTNIEGGAFGWCVSLESIAIPQGVTAINGGTFAGCTGLTHVELPAGLRTIEYFAFSGCTGLSTIVLPASVETVGNHAFSGCTGLTSVTLPAGLAGIDNGAFSNCTSLQTAYFLGNAPAVGSDVFKATHRDATVYYREGTTGWAATFAGLPTQVAAVPYPAVNLSATSIAENQPADTVVGTLSTTEQHVGNTFTYTLVSGISDTDNAAFNISGSRLRASAILDRETKSSFSVRVRSTDQAGEFIEKAFTIIVTEDTTPPAPPTIVRVVDDVPVFVGNILRGGITNDSRPRVVGTAEPGSAVTLRSGTTTLGTAFADSQGMWGITTGSLADGGHALTAIATDADNNSSDASEPFGFTVDTVGPASPIILAVTDNVGTVTGNVSPGGRTDDTTLRISGTADPMSRVTVRSGNAVLRTVFANAFGNWVVVTDPLQVRLHNLNAVARDAAGNNSVPSGNHTVTIDQTSPAILSFGAMALAGSYAQGSQIAIFARTSERMRAGSAIDVTLNTGTVVRLSTSSARSELNGKYRVAPGAFASPLSIVSVATVSPIASDIAGNPFAGLPSMPGALAGINVTS